MAALLLATALLSPLSGQAVPERDTLWHRSIAIIHAPQDSATADVVRELLDIYLARMAPYFGPQDPTGARIRIAANKRDFFGGFHGNVPEWAGALYIPSQRMILVKSPRWMGSHTKLEQDVRHELTHLFVDIAFAPHEVPVWYNEGLAEFLSGEQVDTGRSLQLAWMVSRGDLLPLDSLSRMIRFSSPRAELAYLQSLTAVQHMARELETTAAWADFHHSVAEMGWTPALNRHLGMTPAAFEARYLEDLKARYNPLVILNTEYLLWIALIGVGVIGFAWMRHRRRVILARWEREEDGPAG